MPRGGYRVGAGRPKGIKKGEESVAKQVEKEIMTVMATHTNPLDYMLAVMNDQLADPERRDRMAVSAAAYLHAKPAAQGKKDTRKEDAKKAGTGKFASAAPPPLKIVA